jgi:hypothetical protein
LIDIGNIKALMVFADIEDFFYFTENLYNIKDWTIYDSSYKDRAESLEKYPYWTTLKEMFNEKELIYWNIGDEQLVSFFDTMSIMYKVFKKINEKTIINEMKIIMEYRIPAPNKPRADYLLCYRNNIIIVECSKVSDINKMRNTTAKKAQELAQYKEQLISVLCSDNIKIICHPCIYLHDNSRDNKLKNQEVIDQMLDCINRHFVRCKNAFEILRDIK